MDYWNEGERAFAFWDEDEHFYPATIVSIDGEDIYIHFDSGEEEWTEANYLEDYAVNINDEVECQSSRDGLYYDVVIKNLDGERIEVEYDDETTEWTTLDRLRFFVEE